MKPMSRILLILACLAAHARAFNEETTRVADELVTTLQAEAKELAVDGDDNQANALRQYIRQVKSAIDQTNNRSLNQYLDNLGNFDPSKEAQQAIEALKQAVQKEYDGNTQAAISELRGVIAQAQEKVSRAVEPEELDKLIETLTRIRKTSGNSDPNLDSNDPTLRTLKSEIDDARQFTITWQDYLHASNRGDSSASIRALKNLTQRDYSLIPRSKLIARMDFEQIDYDEIAKITDAISSLEEIKPAIAKLIALRGSSQFSSSDNAELDDTLRVLTRLESTYRQFLAGLPVNLEVLYQPKLTHDPTDALDFVTLRAKLLLLVLPRHLALSDDLQAEQGESVDEFLKRALMDAEKRGDSIVARRIVDTRRNLARATTLNEDDVDALRHHAAGLSQLAAGQYALAVFSFQSALAAGSDLIPAVSTGEKLAKIQRDQPEEFEQGMMEFLTPRPTPEYDYSRMRYMASRYRDANRNTNRDTTVVLPIPAKDPTPPLPARPKPPTRPEPPARPKPPARNGDD